MSSSIRLININSTSEQHQREDDDPIDPEWLKQNAVRLDAAVEKAYKLIEDFSAKYDQDQNNDAGGSIVTTSENPWKDPQKMYMQLQGVRDELNAAWADQPKRTQAKHASLSSADFRTFYIDMITDAFADSLQTMQESGEDINLDVLADCLQSGIDLYNDRDREMLYREFGDDNDESDDDDEEEGGMTPHRRNQIALGIPLVEPSS